MAQGPLPPPPQTGGPIDGWLYLLWRRLTQAGQILWGTITPGTSADVAAVVTDETGSPGSLVFSGNPTLTGLTVSGAAFTSRGITDSATTTALTIDSDKWIGIGAAPIPTVPLLIYHPTTSGLTIQGDASTVLQFQRFSTDATAASINFKKARGTAASQTAVASGDNLGVINFSGWGGSGLAQGAYIQAFVDTYVSSSDVSTYLTLSTRAAATSSPVENARIAANGTVTLGGTSTAPALKVTPVASQARWVEVTGATSSATPSVSTSGGDLALTSNAGSVVVAKTTSTGIKVDPAAPTFPWQDMLGPIGTRSTGGSEPAWTVYRGSIYAYTFDTATAECFLTFHIPHDFLPSQASMLIHMHWSQKVVDTGGTAGVPGVAEWNFDVSYADGHGTAGGAADPFTAPATFTVTQQASTTQYGHMIAEVEFANNGGTGGKLNTATMQVDGLILVRAYRIKGNAADTLNQAPFGHTCDIHYQSTGIGTKQNNPITTGSFYT